jgi:hypothetical protein
MATPVRTASVRLTRGTLWVTSELSRIQGIMCYDRHSALIILAHVVRLRAREITCESNQRAYKSTIDDICINRPFDQNHVDIGT